MCPLCWETFPNPDALAAHEAEEEARLYTLDGIEL